MTVVDRPTIGGQFLGRFHAHFRGGIFEKHPDRPDFLCDIQSAAGAARSVQRCQVAEAFLFRLD
jgi:hypothetical protein